MAISIGLYSLPTLLILMITKTITKRTSINDSLWLKKMICDNYSYNRLFKGVSTCKIITDYLVRPFIRC